MHDERTIIEARFRREFFTRIRPQIHTLLAPLTITAHELPGEPEPYAAIADAPFAPISSGERWGRPWGTTWFRFDGTVPADWPGDGLEAVLDLGFTGSGPGFQAEGLVYENGVPRRGIHPRNHAVPLLNTVPGQDVSLLVEAASNPDFSTSYSPNPLGSREARGGDHQYRLGGCYLARRNPDVDGLVFDLETLEGVIRGLDKDDPRRHRLLRSIERALDALDLHDIVGTAADARSELAPALAVPARASAHKIIAVGHAHIDTAWLWPLRETARKCTRTFSSAVELMDLDPDYRFACSQAVQYRWIEERHPTLFARIADKVKAGQWLPVGGMWVEADMNLPGGESLVRQLVHGQRYFEDKFGVRCREVWIPDVFGYPGSLPQIFAAGGCDRFITQKLSWNKQNKMPHHTFWWEGIDGTRVLTHFPPVDNYNGEITPRELGWASKNFADKGWSDWSLLPFGYGDGGGGPTRDMLERARRMADLDGVGPVSIGTVDEFFEHVEADGERGDTPTWRGELYFEMHRGTLTSQFETKSGNRRAELLLRQAELWTAASADDARRAQFDELWKRVLVQQFHDIIPGSSINWVHADAEEDLAAVAAELEGVIAEALQPDPKGPAVLANAATHPRDGVVIVQADVAPDATDLVQQLADGTVAFRAALPGLAVGPAAAVAIDDPVHVEGRTMANGSVSVTWDDGGDLVSVIDRRAGREVLPAGRRVGLTLAPDHPVEYDAWDLERWTPRHAAPVGAGTVTIEDSGPQVVTVRVDRAFGDSTVTQRYRLRAGSALVEIDFDIDWHEDEKVLCFDTPLDIRADTAACGIQFGSVDRPMHTNTSWDLAKFEVCAHRWVDVTEPGFGVAVLDDGRYGHALQDGGVRVTLLRAARYPDPVADRGRHTCRLGILPHAGDRAEVVREAEAFELPIRRFGFGEITAAASTADSTACSVVDVSGDSVLVSAVKSADDGSGDLIVRLHEAVGGRARATLGVPGAITGVTLANLLEEPQPETDDAAAPRWSSTSDQSTVTVDLRPFQLVTLRLARP